MVKIENHCISCPPEIGCLGEGCPKRHVRCYYCDDCKFEAETYFFDDEELCLDCIEKRLDKVADE